MEGWDGMDGWMGLQVMSTGLAMGKVLVDLRHGVFTLP